MTDSKGISEDMNRRNRRTMEDSHCYNLDFMEKEGWGLFGVFDGHAGKSAAEWCGENMAERFKELLQSRKEEEILELLHRLFIETDEELCSQKGIHSGCTAAVAFTNIENGKRMLYCANAGDARVVLQRGEKAIRLSYDHKGQDPAEIKRIIDSGGFIMNNRVNGILAVTRSLGDMSMKDLVLSKPYTTETQLTKQDKMLIVACDGIWDILSDQEAVNLVKDIEDPQEAADFLVKHVLENNSMDNITCMVIKFVDN